jgi:hypothetical protein
MPTTTKLAGDNPRLDGATEWIRYYDVEDRWFEKIEPHLLDKRLNAILVRDFNKFTRGRWNLDFQPGDLPRDFEPCDCRSEMHVPHPPYWDYVARHACHWLVNFYLKLANLAEPQQRWRIIHSERHSSVWDGSYTLFDPTFLAYGVEPWDCFSRAYEKELSPGRPKKVMYAGHHTEEAWPSTCRPIDMPRGTRSDARRGSSSTVRRSA